MLNQNKIFIRQTENVKEQLILVGKDTEQGNPYEPLRSVNWYIHFRLIWAVNYLFNLWAINSFSYYVPFTCVLHIHKLEKLQEFTQWENSIFHIWFNFTNQDWEKKPKTKYMHTASAIVNSRQGKNGIKNNSEYVSYI